MMMALGMFVFSLPTLAYEELQRRTSWRHVQNPRFGARAANQFLGPGDDLVSLSGRIPPELSDVSSLATLRDLADAGDALPLVDGRGQVYGDFVIESLEERQAAFLDDGSPMRIDFGLELRRVPDGADGRVQGAEQVAQG
ncbi:MAG: phage tail protein [Caulobacter sp.]|nr:phage tail protein [Caulobacter sp.]